MATLALVVMGPSGCGKSTLGAALAERLGWRFAEGDELHPPENTAKMAAGQPLTDADRAPWLAAVARVLAEAEGGIVITCSALKREYRDRLRAARPDAVFVLPDLPPELLHQRLSGRGEHFMPASLLGSQLAMIERPDSGERAVVVDGRALTERQVAMVLESLTQF